MNATTTSVAMVGGDVRPVTVEVHIGRQGEQFKLTGLPDTAVREAKDRVKAAMASSGVKFPNREVTVNLSPASLPKQGSDYDVPIALSVMAASGDSPRASGVVVVGELALNGAVRSGASAIPAAVLAARLGWSCLVPSESATQAAMVPSARVYPMSTLAEGIEELRVGLSEPVPSEVSDEALDPARFGDMADVGGQPLAKRAVEIAATGGHHLLVHGPPGGGKTMLINRLAGLGPPLTEEQAIEVGLVYAAAGLDRGVSTVPPFRAPHHTATRAALVGGGSGMPVPGEVSLATHGVLFLDELAEFPRAILDTLRQPMESGRVSIARKGVSVSFPSKFQLVAASNPCPCGFSGDRKKSCECRPAAVARYRERVSGPLLDRFDLVVKVGRVETPDNPATEESSASIAERVARGRQRVALVGPPSAAAQSLVNAALLSGAVTARGAHAARRIATTIAALDDADVVAEPHIAEALALRGAW